MELSQNVNSASKWSLLSEIVAKLMLPITNMVLARILAPEAFGMVATITMVTSFADIFADAGFQKFLVQKDFENSTELNNNTTVAFWTNMTFSVVLWVIVFAFRNDIATLVGNDGLGNAIAIASLSLPLTALSSIQIARYKREMDFKTLFLAKLISIVVPVVVTIPLAIILKSFWALVIGTLCTNFLNAVVLTIKSKWKPNFYFKISLLKKMISFSAWTLTEQLLGWANANIGIFVVGKLLSDYYLGIYKTSIASTNQLLSIIVNSISPVILSSLSRLKDDEEKFKDVFYTFENRVAILVIPIGVGVFIYRDLFTQVLLGSQWMEATQFIGLWALMRSILIVFGMFSMEVFVSKGKPKFSVLSQMLELLALIPVLLISAPLGYEILYISRCGVVVWSIIVKCTLLYAVEKISALKILKLSIPYIVSAVIMGLFGFAFNAISDNIIWRLVSVIICIVIYFGVLLINPYSRKNVILLAKNLLYFKKSTKRKH